MMHVLFVFFASIGVLCVFCAVIVVWIIVSDKPESRADAADRRGTYTGNGPLVWESGEPIDFPTDGSDR